jgi:tRNA A37 threonylcarbamoyladenosine modification protein TsaB
MGMVTARTLAQQLQIPLFAISTLEAAAWASCHPAWQSTLLSVEMPAQSGQVYGAVYSIDQAGRISLKQPEQELTLAEWQLSLEQLEAPFQSVKISDSTPKTTILCQAMLKIANQGWKNGDRPDWSAALPFYGQQAWRSSHG